MTIFVLAALAGSCSAVIWMIAEVRDGIKQGHLVKSQYLKIGLVIVTAALWMRWMILEG